MRHRPVRREPDPLRLTPTERQRLLGAMADLLITNATAKKADRRTPWDVFGQIWGTFSQVGLIRANGEVVRYHSWRTRPLYLVTPHRITQGRFICCVASRDKEGVLHFEEAYCLEIVEADEGEKPEVAGWCIDADGHHLLLGSNGTPRAIRYDAHLRRLVRIVCPELQRWSDQVLYWINYRNQPEQPRKDT